MKGILIDDSEFDRMEEECLRRLYGDEGYERMKAEEEAEKNMSRRQRRKKRPMQDRKSGFNVPFYFRFLPEGTELVELENGRFKLVIPEDEDNP